MFVTLQESTVDRLTESKRRELLRLTGSFDQLLQHIPVSPTRSSNWLIPGRLLIGEYPTIDNATHLVQTASIDCFVNLVGTDTVEAYRHHLSPATQAGSASSQALKVNFIHFPITDGGALPVNSLIGLVLQLMELLLNGRSIFVHCQSGRGRTGMVVIPLLSALYDVPADTAQEYVVHSTCTTRETLRRRRYPVEMPETDEQVEAMQCAANELRALLHRHEN